MKKVLFLIITFLVIVLLYVAFVPSWAAPKTVTVNKHSPEQIDSFQFTVENSPVVIETKGSINEGIDNAGLFEIRNVKTFEVIKATPKDLQQGEAQAGYRISATLDGSYSLNWLTAAKGAASIYAEEPTKVVFSDPQYVVIGKYALGALVGFIIFMVALAITQMFK